jgi:hypothetical protein
MSVRSGRDVEGLPWLLNRLGLLDQPDPPLHIRGPIPISSLPQRTLLWTLRAAGVTASFDGTVHGRMYSGSV